MPQLTDASGHTAPPSIWRDPATWSRPERAGHYRKQAVRFQRMAEAEKRRFARDRLFDLAGQSNGIAEALMQGFCGAAPFGEEA